MAYIPTEWQTGEVITAAKLNNIEDGIVANEEAIAGAYPVVLPITIDEQDTLHIGKSWDDLMDLTGVPVFAQYDISDTVQNRYFLNRLYVDTGVYYAVFMGADTLTFSAESASDELELVD